LDLVPLQNPPQSLEEFKQHPPDVLLAKPKQIPKQSVWFAKIQHPPSESFWLGPEHMFLQSLAVGRQHFGGMEESLELRPLQVSLQSI